MLRQDVFFAERNFSENYCIKRLQKATEMSSYSSKRKRTDEQCLGPEAASNFYERPGMSFLTMPFTSGTHTEIEHPRKRFHPSTDQAVLQNIGTTCTLDRVALSGADQVLSNEQVQQFIHSTVLARHRTIPKLGSSSNVGYWSHSQSESRPTEQIFQASLSGTQQKLGMGRFPTQSIGTLQTQDFTFEQEIASPDCVVPLKQTQQCARTENEKSTDKPRKKRRSKTSQVPIGSQTASYVDDVHNTNNQQPSDRLTTTHHVTTGDHFQNSPTNEPGSWSLVPQPVLMHVKPMEAQTNQTISRLLALREAEKNGYPQVVAKRKSQTTQSDFTSNKRKKTKGQSQGHDCEEISTEQTDGKKTVKRIVVPPKIRQNPISYPPYVNRIMKILARGQQNQTETSDDSQDNYEKLIQIGSNKLGTESVSKQTAEVQLKPRVSEKFCQGITEKREPIAEFVSKEIKQNVTRSRNVDIKKFLEDLPCDSILNTDHFYGPEMFVNSGDQCYVESATFM